MSFLTRFSLKNSVVVVIAAVLLVAGGWYSAQQLKRETMPDVSIPIVAVVVPYPGAAPADVYDKVTEPAELAIARVAGIQNTSGISNDSVSIVIAEFSYSQDMDVAEADVAEALDTVMFPEEALDATTSRVSMGSQPILKFSVGGDVPADELQASVRDVLVPAVESVEGVGEVTVSNSFDESVRIVFDDEALEDQGLSEQDVIQQLQAANLSFPVGSTEVGGVDQPIRVSGTLATVEDIENFKVAIYPDPNAMYAGAFEQMGEGMGQLGSAVGQLGSAVGEIGVGVGQLGAGVGQMGQTLGTQVGLSAALTQVQGQTLDAKIQLSSAESVLRDLESVGATNTPEYQQAQMAAMQLEQVIPALEQAEQSIADEMKNAAASAPTQPSAPVGPPSSGSVRSSSGGSVDMEMEEPTIEMVLLKEVADVSYGTEEGAVYSRANGDPAVLIDVVKTQDANTVDVSDAVKETVDEVLGGQSGGSADDQSQGDALTISEAMAAEATSEMPSGTSVVYTFDGAEMINDSIADMIQEGLLGALFAFIVILLFLRNIRATLISAISIPMSVVLALLFMRFAGVTMNVMTLGGLTVAIGRVVDDSIVVIENVFNHLQKGDERGVGLIQKATAEVSSAITSSTLTTVAVFAPMTLVSGIVGKIFTPFALTVAVALLASLLVSLTIVPLLAKWSLLRTTVRPRDERTTRTGLAYQGALRWALDHAGIVVSAATLLFIGSLALLPVIGFGFMPPATEPYISVDVEYPAGFTATDVDEALAVIETGLAQDEQVEFYTSTVQQDDGFNMASGITGGNAGTMFVRLYPDSDVDAALLSIQETSEPLKSDGARVTVSQVSMAGGSENLVEVIVTGPIEGIEAAIPQITGSLSGIPGLENVSSNLSEKRPQVVAEVDQARAAEYGLNAAMVAGTIRGYVAEQSAGSTEIDGQDAEIIYVTALDAVDSAEDIASRTLRTPLGDEVMIGEIAKVESVDTPVSVLTYNEKEYAAVNGSITERDTSSVITAIEGEIAELDLPAGVEVELGGVAQMMSESFEQLALAMLVAIAAVYLVMVITFGEAIAPLAIMFSLPLAIIGGIVGLLIAGMPLDMPGMIGALMLIGIVTTNAIMFVERVNQRLAQGYERREALLDAGANRMRPILMTALTTIMALVPMASGFADGALMSQSLAIVVVGGLTTSTVLTLIVVPVMYDLLEGLKERVLGSTSVDDGTADSVA